MALGQIIGKITVKYKTTWDKATLKNAAPSHEFKHDLNFTNCSDEQIKAWLCNDRVIYIQGKERSIKMVDAIKQFDNTAFDCSKKLVTSTVIVKKMTEEEVRNNLLSVGIPADLIDAAVAKFRTEGKLA